MEVKHTIPKHEYPSLIRTYKGPLVLLFFDGYDRKALPGVSGTLASEIHRLARYTKRTLYRQQVHTGFYTAFLSLYKCLKAAGCDVRVNDFSAAARWPRYPIGIAGYPSVLNKVNLPNPRIFGPGDFGLPPDSISLAHDPRYFRLIQPSEWFADLYRGYCKDKMMVWYAGIDIRDWPDLRHEPKAFDFLVYDKIRWNRDARVPEILDRITRHLTSRGNSFTILRYGHHHHSDFKKALKLSRAMLFVCEHETQGLAYQEALAANIPVLAWDEGQMADPYFLPFVSPSTAISSVPYFADTCGMRFTLADFERTCDRFVDSLPSFTPREYVAEHLSPDAAAMAYLTEYHTIADRMRCTIFPSPDVEV